MQKHKELHVFQVTPSKSPTYEVEEYIKDLEDGDTLLDMMAASTQIERTTLKRGEAIYPEVPHPCPI